METIELVDAAEFYKGLPHQATAWNWLQQQLSKEQVSEFAEKFRDAPAVVPEQALVTEAQCKSVFGREITASQLEDLNSCLERFDIATTLRIRHFMAQIGHESGGLKWLKETADGTAYEGRRDLGNTMPGDGPRYKGAGAIQLTGRFNYSKFASFIGDTKIMEGCDYVSSRYPFTSAGFWWHSNGMNSLVDSGASCRKISARVNGRDPANGLADREKYFSLATQFISGGVAAAATADVDSTKKLAVPYYSQLDSAFKQQADRMCFSSSCAMLLAFLNPDSISRTNGDDEYLQKLIDLGRKTADSGDNDTTQAPAQLKTLEAFGISARFKTDCDFSTIESQVRRGIPVPCGFLHHGPVDAPVGGGHWLCVVGFTPTHVIVNDPNGEIDLLAGRYLANKNGKELLYSRKNFGRRWMVENNGRYAPGKGWAIIADPLN